MSGRERAAEVLAQHGPTFTERAADPTTTFYCKTCSDALGDWVTSTPDHLANVLAGAGLLADDMSVQLTTDAIEGHDKALARLARVEALADEWEREAGTDSDAWRVFGPQKVGVPFAVEAIRDALRGDA